MFPYLGIIHLDENGWQIWPLGRNAHALGQRVKKCAPTEADAPDPLLHDPPEFARLIVSGLPSLSDHLMVVRVGAPSDNKLRMMRPSAISGTKARVTGDDDFVTSHYDE